MNLEKIQAGVNRIRRVLQARNEGCANEEARREIFDACNFIERSSDEGDYIIEKGGDIRIATDSLFSARKHLKFQQRGDSGILDLRSRIESSLHRIETWPHVLERMNSTTKISSNTSQ